MSEPKVPPDVHDEAYVEEKAERFMFKCPGFPMGATRAPYLLRDLIRQIVKEIEDKHWADKEYLNDTIQEMKKQLDEKKPKVSRGTIYDYVDTEWKNYKEHNPESYDVKAMIWDFLEKIGIKVTDK